LPSQELFKIGDWVTNCVVLEGTGRECFKRENISCYLENTPLQLPAELQSLKNRIESNQLRIQEETGEPTYFNGPMVALSSYKVSRTPDSEDTRISLSFLETDYYSFLSTSMSMNEEIKNSEGISSTIQTTYLSHPDYTNPIPYIATSFGVNLSIVTNDDLLVISERGSNVSHYGGMYSVPILESVNPSVDKIRNVDRLDIYNTAIRGAEEELGIRINPEEVKLTSLNIDTKYYLYGFSGFIVTDKYSFEELIALRARGIKDKTESGGLTCVKFDPEEVAKYIRYLGGVSKFHPSSFVSIIHTLTYEFGERLVKDKFSEISPTL
jgi:hypothetical protein